MAFGQCGRECVALLFTFIETFRSVADQECPSCSHKCKSDSCIATDLQLNFVD